LVTSLVGVRAFEGDPKSQTHSHKQQQNQQKQGAIKALPNGHRFHACLSLQP
jgi:hypothetical protein